MRQATCLKDEVRAKISIIRWSVHVSLTATGRNYEQFRWYWPWHLIIIYKFDQIDEADCMFIFQIKHQYSFWIIAHILFNALLRVLTWLGTDFHDPVLVTLWPRSWHNFERHHNNLSSVNYLMTTVKNWKSIRSFTFTYLFVYNTHDIKTFPLFIP